MSQPEDNLARPLTTLTEVFSQVPITHEAELAIIKACELIRSDPGVELTLQVHIIERILTTKGLPDALHLARTIIGIHKASDSGSVQAFVEMFLGGMKYLRTATDLAPVRDEESVEGSNEETENDRNPPKLQDRNPSLCGPICEISGHHGPAAYLVDTTILPCAIGDTEHCQVKQQPLWDLLCCFWKAPVVDKMLDQCGKKNISGTNYFTNGLFLSSYCRQAYKAFEFYLLPIPSTFTPTSYDVEFHWIHKPSINAQANYRTVPVITEDYYLEYETFNTGDRIVFKTVDPIKCPLPDPGLLFARAFLATICLPFEEHIVAERLLFGYDFADDDSNPYPNSGDWENDEIVIEPTGSDIEAWIDDIPEWLGFLSEVVEDGGGEV